MTILKDKVAIITGSSKGIGKEIAIRYLEEGCNVVLVSRTKALLEKVAHEVSKLQGSTLVVEADVSERTAVSGIVESTLSHFGHIDILVNNAAIIHGKTNVVDFDIEKWKKIIDVNLTGAFLMSKSVLPAMINQKYGKIINISSIGGRRGAKGRSAYRVSKAALINFTETLAAEVHELGISVNGICPGAVDTEMFTSIFGRKTVMMKAKEIAEVALFLASDNCTAITGTCIDAFGSTNPLFK